MLGLPVTVGAFVLLGYQIAAHFTPYPSISELFEMQHPARSFVLLWIVAFLIHLGGLDREK